jgi:hypothetical protein
VKRNDTSPEGRTQERERALARFWRTYEARNNGPTVEQRVAELERIVAELTAERGDVSP